MSGLHLCKKNCDYRTMVFILRKDLFKESSHISLLYTITIWIQDKSGILMVQTNPVVKWSGFWMVVWKLDKKCLFYGLNVWSLNGLPNQVIRPFDKRTKSVRKVKCLDFRCLLFRWLLYKLTVILIIFKLCCCMLLYSK